MCAYIHAHWKRGRANTHQTCTQTGASIRSLLDLLSCWVSCTASAQRLEPGVKIRTQKYLFTPLFCPSGPVLARTLQITSVWPVQLELPSFAAVPSPLAGLQTRVLKSENEAPALSSGRMAGVRAALVISSTVTQEGCWITSAVPPGNDHLARQEFELYSTHNTPWNLPREGEGNDRGYRMERK